MSQSVQIGNNINIGNKESFSEYYLVIISVECGQIYLKIFRPLLDLTTPRPILSPHNTQRMTPYSLYN